MGAAASGAFFVPFSSWRVCLILNKKDSHPTIRASIRNA
jgi:hypothetical protein